MRVPTPNGGEMLLTRRHFLFGALGVGALAAVGGGAAVVIQHANQSDEEEITVLDVPPEAVSTSDACTEVVADDYMGLVATVEMPYGTLVWSNSEDVAACLIPTEGSKPLAQIALLSLGSGTYETVVEQAVGQDEGFEIYDVRATATGMIWTEADILEGIWRIYTVRVDGMSVGEPVLADEGNGEWETPTIAVVGSRAFWQVLPKADGPRKAEDSVLKRASVGTANAEVVFSSHGRMSTPPYPTADAIVITPRTDTSSVHHKLTCIDAATGDVRDTMVLPKSMKPLEAGYGETGFMFSFDAIYNYGGGIANLGTYVPASRVTDGSYSGAPWFRFSKTPTAAPAWCGSFLMVKASTAVCGIDLDANTYFAFDVKSGADKYGEYLASTGSGNSVVTYTNIDDKPINGAAKKLCLVRVWQPLG